MISAESFWTSSLHLAPDGDRITRILAAAINGVDPCAAVKHFVKREGNVISISGRTYHLNLFRRIVLLGIGKASIAMAEGLIEILGSKVTDTLVIPKTPGNVSHPKLNIHCGGHPVPDELSLEAGKKTTELVSSLGPDDLLFCLISGGGSALVASPIIGISLADIQELTSVLLACGASIEEINSLRRRLDTLKGGGMVKLAGGANIVSLILSDVVGNPLETIASGPTAPDPGTRTDAISIVTKYALETRIPVSIINSLKMSIETPKPGDPIFAKVQNVIVGSNLLAAQAALSQAKVEGFHPYLLCTDLQGEARQVAFELATSLRQASLTSEPIPAPACIIAGGETTVIIKGKGKGGRNTELALAAVTELADFPKVMLVTLATDGEDGPTDAAGAVVTGGTFHRAIGLGLQPELFLGRNDSYSFFFLLDDLLKPGSTGTNTNDLVLMFIF
jgi:glycerate 2-kinase